MGQSLDRLVLQYSKSIVFNFTYCSAGSLSSVSVLVTPQPDATQKIPAPTLPVAKAIGRRLTEKVNGLSTFTMPMSSLPTLVLPKSSCIFVVCIMWNFPSDPSSFVVPTTTATELNGSLTWKNIARIHREVAKCIGCKASVFKG